MFSSFFLRSGSLVVGSSGLLLPIQNSASPSRASAPFRLIFWSVRVPSPSDCANFLCWKRARERFFARPDCPPPVSPRSGVNRPFLVVYHAMIFFSRPVNLYLPFPRPPDGQERPSPPPNPSAVSGGFPPTVKSRGTEEHPSAEPDRPHLILFTPLSRSSESSVSRDLASRAFDFPFLDDLLFFPAAQTRAPEAWVRRSPLRSEPIFSFLTWVIDLFFQSSYVHDPSFWEFFLIGPSY